MFVCAFCYEMSEDNTEGMIIVCDDDCECCDEMINDDDDEFMI